MKKTEILRNSVSSNAIDNYLATVPEPARTTLNQVCATIRSVVPAETTETISYGIPTFKYKGSLFGFAAFAKHCSLFPMSAALIAKYKSDLKAFPTSKGTIRFPVDKPPSSTLIKKLVKARIVQIEKAAKK